MSVPMKYLIFFSILIASAFGSSFAFANPCEDTRQLKNLWETKYIKLVQNPEALGSGFDPSSMAYKLANAICILEYPGLPNYDGMFYRYLNAMIKSIIVEVNSPFINPHMIGSTPQIGILALHDEFFRERPDMPFPRVSTLLHEARHIELDLYKKPNQHVTCTRGKFANKQSYCDKEFGQQWETASPRSYEVMFLSQLYEKSQYYQSAWGIKNYVNDSLNNYFNEVDKEAYDKYYK